MSPDEQTRFVAEQAERVSLALDPKPYKFDQQSIEAIKTFVDLYAARENSLSDEMFGEGLRPVYSRASDYAPHIIRAFKKRGVPPIIGLYIPMVETEYHPCAKNDNGALGLFGFIGSTAREYGVDSNDRCDVTKMAPAAAEYIADRIAEFGTDSGSLTLAILAYNRSPDSVRRDLRKVAGGTNEERSFWTLLHHADQFDTYFREEALKYVPQFFAAAIVGENPDAFGLPIRPLSTYTEPDAAPPGSARAEPPR
jgi:membrane-bound lytic murein transglycosylase D